MSHLPDGILYYSNAKKQQEIQVGKCDSYTRMLQMNPSLGPV